MRGRRLTLELLFMSPTVLVLVLSLSLATASLILLPSSGILGEWAPALTVVSVIAAGLLFVWRFFTGPARLISAFVTLAVTEAYLLRVAYIALSDEPFTYTHVAALLPDRAAVTLAYLAAILVFFFVGIYLGGRAAGRIRVRAPLVGGDPYRPLIVLVAVSSLVQLGVNAVLGLSWQGTAASGLIFLLPGEVGVFLLVHHAVDDWSRWPGHRRATALATLSLYSGAWVAAGYRSAVLTPVLALVGSLLYQRAVHGRRVALRHGIALVLLILIALPPALSVVMTTREVVRGRGSTVAGAALDDLIGRPGVRYYDLPATLQLLTNRQASFDQAYAAMWGSGSDISTYATPGALVAATVANIVPDAIVRLDAPPTGQLFAVYFQEHRWESGHFGAFSLPGMLYVYFGPAESLLMSLVLGFITMRLVRRLSYQGDALRAGLAVYIAAKLSFQLMESGNLDIIASNVVRQVAGLLIVLAILRVLQSGSSSQVSARQATSLAKAHV